MQLSLPLLATSLLVFLLLTIGLIAPALAQSPCPDGQVQLRLLLNTDGFSQETSWEIVLEDGTRIDSAAMGSLDNFTEYTYEYCLDADQCVTIRIMDSFGDGLGATGYYQVFIDDRLVLDYQRFNQVFEGGFNCPAGSDCLSAEVVGLGQHTTTYDDHWYVFVPDTSGLYNISTCGTGSCDTKIWGYDRCPGFGIPEDNAGTLFFDHDKSDCSPRAEVEAALTADESYIIRIGDHENACRDTINWVLSFLGPILGCTNPESCNYDPMATQDDGSCIPFSDPACDLKPDLVLREDVLRQTIVTDRILSSDPCLLEEGCLRGYGWRDVIRFSTFIENNGTADYYIGIPAMDNPQFTYDNCHNHFHYEGYAEYLMFDQDHGLTPIGYKNGFCVIDLGCENGGGRKYTCGNMGITKGCYDEYWTSLECQWIDVTELPDGVYTFVARINWDNDPDALGRVESDTLNNWAQACIELDRSSGELQVFQLSDCPTVMDCTGQPYGDVREDCTGECGGTTLHGDLDGSSEQNYEDVQLYIDHMMSSNLDATPCNDLNQDGRISIYDAALLNTCISSAPRHNHITGIPHNHCNFPAGRENPLDTIQLSFLDHNVDEKYIDVGLLNAASELSAWQLAIDGIIIDSVASLIDEHVYPISLRHSLLGNTIYAISPEDSIVPRSFEPQPLVRVYYHSFTDEMVCLDMDQSEWVNSFTERIPAIEIGNCLIAVGTHPPTDPVNVQAGPNPWSDAYELHWTGTGTYTFELHTTSGQRIRYQTGLTDGYLTLHRESLPAGVYWWKLHSATRYAVGRVVVQ